MEADFSPLAELRARQQAVRDEGREAELARQRSLGKRSARERLATLVDFDSFDETGTLVKPEAGSSLPEGTVVPADGVITGSATIDGRPVQIVSYDYSVLGGSNGGVGIRKVDRHARLALEHGQPFIMLMDGGGHRIQEGLDARHFARGFDTCRYLAQLSGWAPIVAAIMGPGFAGPTSFAALADLVVLVRGMATMGMAGPALVKASLGEDIDKQALGGADLVANEYGVADLVVDTEDECNDAIRRFLSYLPTNAGESPPVAPGPATPGGDQSVLSTYIPSDPKRAYDVKVIIETIADRGSLFELKPGYAKNIVTTFARLDGHPVGIAANQPLHLGGALDAAATEKMAHFVSLCDAFGLPLVTFIDVPGFVVGSQAERTGLARRCGRLLFELGQATVPRFSVVMRKGYGLAYGAMNGGRSYEADLALAWPTAEISAMAVEGAVDVVYRNDIRSVDDPAARRAELIAKFKAQLSAFRAAEDYGIDEIIDPSETRARLINGIARSRTRRVGLSIPKKHGISPI